MNKEKIHNTLIHVLCLPLYAYFTLVAVFEWYGDKKIEIGNKRWLKKMHLTEEEFEEFMEWRSKIKHENL